MHRHHKIPKHAGGTDDPENIVLLTPEEHAAAHMELYETYGRREDLGAYNLLMGEIRKARERELALEFN